jgi:GAF domain-containing protein
VCEDLKIGTVAILDDKPRPDFNEFDESILLDIVRLVSCVVAEQRENVQESELRLAKLLIDTRYHFQSPIETLREKFSSIQAQVLSIRREGDESESVPKVKAE